MKPFCHGFCLFIFVFMYLGWVFWVDCLFFMLLNLPMKFEDSPFDIQRVFETLYRVEKLLHSTKMPSCRSYSPSVSGGSDGIGGGYIYLGEIAYDGCEGISEAVSSYIQTGKWGRPKTKVAFWLKEFLQTSIRYFLAARKTPPYADCTLRQPENVKPILGKTDQEVLEWLLTERWHEYMCPLWLKENAPSYVYTESWDMDRFSEAERARFRDAFDELADSDFVWNSDGSFFQNHRGDFPYNYIYP